VIPLYSAWNMMATRLDLKHKKLKSAEEVRAAVAGQDTKAYVRQM